MIDELVHNASDPAFAVDAEQRITAWNEKATALLGYAAEEMVGKSCPEVMNVTGPGGETLCHPGCEASLCFAHCQPYGATTCSIATRHADRISVDVSSVALPPHLRGRADGNAVAIIFLHESSVSQVTEASQASVRVFTFKNFDLVISGRAIPTVDWHRKQSLTLLKYLALHLGETIHRAKLIDLLWPDLDESSGSERLKVVIYYLRKKLREVGAPEETLQLTAEGYCLNPTLVWVDCKCFEELARQGQRLNRKGEGRASIQSFEIAVRLYRGDIFEEDPYVDWCEYERERLREFYFRLMMQLCNYYSARGDFERAVQLCRMALIREPTRESFHRTLMRNLDNWGKPELAMAQFRRCARLLQSELDTTPSEQLQALHDEIKARIPAKPD